MAETLIHLPEKQQFNGSHEFMMLSSKNRDFLLSPNGTQVKISKLQTKVIGIYFSANWYEPCQKFTLVLANAYEQLKTYYDPGFEVVFVSSDEDIDSFNNYRASMPWLPIPFSDLDTKRALSRKFQVETLPTLIFLHPNDSTIQQGVDIIYRYGIQAYPFTKTKLDELLLKEKKINENQSLRDLLVTKNDKDFLMTHSVPDVVSTTFLSGMTFGFYFAAQWCSPAEKFTPKLASIYEKINHQINSTLDSETKFEIVFVSSDHDQTTFNSYFNTMPWLALPFGDPNIKSLGVQDIPSLIIIGPDGKTVTKQGRRLVNLYEESSYPFTRGRIELLEKELDEEGSKLPKSEYHFGHSHELMLVSKAMEVVRLYVAIVTNRVPDGRTSVSTVVMRCIPSVLRR